MGNAEILAALRASRLARELTDAQAHCLAEYLVFRDLLAGEVLVPEGTSDNHLYAVVRGTLGVVRNFGSPDAVSLFTIVKGDFVGELSFIDETRHYATLVAVEPTRVIGLEREKLEGLLATQPEIVYRVMRAIVRAVHEIQRRISMQSAELTNYIYKQHGRY